MNYSENCPFIIAGLLQATLCHFQFIKEISQVCTNSVLVQSSETQHRYTECPVPPPGLAWPRPGQSSKSNTRYSSVDRKYRIFPKMIKRTKRRLKNMHQTPSSFRPLSATAPSPRIKCSVSPLHLSEMFQNCSVKVKAHEMNAMILPQPSFH